MFDFQLLILQIAVVLGATRIVGLAFRRIRQPQVVGEMTAGILLGPSLLGRVAPEAMQYLFPATGLDPLYALSQVGLILFLFVVGLHVRLDEFRGLARSAVIASVASIVVPFTLGSLLAIPLHQALSTPDVPLPAFILFMGAAMSITAFPVLARILTEGNLLNTRAGVIALSCAAVDDVVAWCLLAVIMAVSAPLLPRFAGLLAYAAVMFFGVRRLLARYRPSFPIALLLLLASSWTTEALGVHALFGAFMAGLVMPRDTELAPHVESLTTILLLPLFFAFTGLRTSLALVSGATLWLYCLGIIAVAVGGKLLGCALAIRATGLAWRESFAVGVLVNTRGLVELVILNIGLERKIISPTLFSMMVVMALVTTFMTRPLLDLIALEYTREVPQAGRQDV
jgi:Kef-type K+ transport system membrane component KefB